MVVSAPSLVEIVIMRSKTCDIFSRSVGQCFDAVGWAARRASGLQKTEWWNAGEFICLGRDADLHMPS